MTMATAEEEIQGQEPQEPKRSKNKGQKAEQEIANLSEAVDPRTIVREQRVAGPKGTEYENFDRTYTQRRLSSFPRLEFIRVVSRAVNEVTATGDVSVSQFADDVAGGVGLESADIMIRLFSKLAITAPETIGEILMLSLGVPNHEKLVVQEIWAMPEDQEGTGGLSDEDMEALISTFIDQNAEAIDGFFRKTLPGLVARTQKILNRNQT